MGCLLITTGGDEATEIGGMVPTEGEVEPCARWTRETSTQEDGGGRDMRDTKMGSALDPAHAGSILGLAVTGVGEEINSSFAGLRRWETELGVGEDRGPASAG